MNTRKFTSLAVLAVGAFALSMMLSISLARAPRPRPRIPWTWRRGVRVPVRPRTLRRLHGRVVLPRRRRLYFRRYGPSVVIGPDGVVIRQMPPPVVVTSVKDLKAPPVKKFDKSIAYKVLRVDADCTPVLDIDGKATQIHLIGIEPGLPEDARELEKNQSESFFRNLLVGEFLYMESDPSLAEKDEDGKVVAYLYRAPDGLFVNMELVRQGYVLTSDYDHRYQDLLSFYEGKARADKKGLWAANAEAGTSEQEESLSPEGP